MQGADVENIRKFPGNLDNYTGCCQVPLKLTDAYSCELYRLNDLVSCATVERESMLISSLKIVLMVYYLEVELEYLYSDNKKMKIQNFIANIDKLNRQQLTNYPHNLIHKIHLRKIARQDCINIDDLLCKHIIVDSLIDQQEISLLLAQIARQNKKNCRFQFLVVNQYLFLAILILSFIALVAHALARRNEDYRPVIAIGGTTVVSAIICMVITIIVLPMRADIERNNTITKIANNTNQLSSLILYLIMTRALIKAVEQAVGIQHGLEGLPMDILNEIILYSIGDVQSAMSNFFDDQQQQLLVNYFNNKQYDIDLEVASECDDSHSINIKLLPS